MKRPDSPNISRFNPKLGDVDTCQKDAPRFNALESRFQGIRHDGNPAWPSFTAGKRGNADSPTFFPRFSIAFRVISGTISPCAGRGDRRVIGCRRGRGLRPGEAASPAAASRGETLAVTVRLPNATSQYVTDST